MDLTQAIEPKSDQLNADDMIAGPKVIKITEVTRGNAEQPVVVHFEGDQGKPWKPCKSMTRVMVRAWGADASQFAGRSVELYCDPKVKWGGMEVGGIRIRSMSHIDKPLKMSLTATRGKRAPYSVAVLEASEARGAQSDDMANGFSVQFDACQTMEELKELWSSIPGPLQKSAEPYKDAAKARLMGGE